MKLDLNRPMRLINPPHSEVNLIGYLKSGKLVFDFGQDYALAYRTNEADKYIENAPERKEYWYCCGGSGMLCGYSKRASTLEERCPNAKQRIRLEYEGDKCVSVELVEKQ